MASTADMSLDAIIRNRRSSGNFRGRGRAQSGRGIVRPFTSGRMAGIARRGPLGVNTRPSSYTIAKSTRRPRSFPWQTDLFEDSIRAAGIQGVEIGTKLYISNLDYGVTNDDIKELFSEIGDVKRYAVHYDKTGRPSGSAEVVYIRRSDAFTALKRYNNVLLDGKPMKIEIIGVNSDVPVRVSVTGVNGRNKRTVFMASSQSGGRGSANVNRGISKPLRGAMGNRRGRGRGRGRGHGRGRGQGNGRGKKGAAVKSSNDLDKDLDTYHAEAMNILLEPVGWGEISA